MQLYVPHYNFQAYFKAENTIVMVELVHTSSEIEPKVAECYKIIWKKNLPPAKGKFYPPTKFKKM